MIFPHPKPTGSTQKSLFKEKGKTEYQEALPRVFGTSKLIENVHVCVSFIS